MSKVDGGVKNVLDELQRNEARLTWEDQVELMENLKEFIDYRLNEVRNENHGLDEFVPNWTDLL